MGGAKKHTALNVPSGNPAGLYDFHYYLLIGVPLRRAQRQPVW
jgi:hypothetical protein